ncbi:hypothetical protein O181_028094 [Austropuccinia psidii MF-1]|uniref:Integrase catalytic domain-containing protein n=1 Tax=Austropuccinia psidii MF-1 TaxID=1389203 RepID=A0A9Q3H386_9BASI|nr:hypothetical protein [Austropuccinia psidii MF-1]
MDLPLSSYHDSLEELWDEEEEPEEVKTMWKVVPSVYHQYLDVFSKVKAERLPPHHSCDHHIKLEGSLPPVGVIYSLSNQESDTLRAYISENVEKGFIRPSSSSTGAPVRFVKNNDGGLHLCVDYHKLIAVTRKNKYPVPPMNQLLNAFSGSFIFSKIYLHGAYKLLRIKEGDEHLTAFRTKYGSYEYLVMPFGLTNDPASFKNLFNNIFQDLLDVYVVISSLTSFLKKNSCFPLSEESLSQFHQLKEAFTTAPILSPFNCSLPTIVETNASNYALSAGLGQVSDSGKHPIAFNRCKHIPADLNSKIHDKQLLGIVWALKSWTAFLISLSSPFEVLTNHSSLQYFISSKILTCRQACWAEFLAEFHFSNTYLPGRLATLPNALSFKVESFSNLTYSIQKALWQDSQYRGIFQELGKGKYVQDYSLDSSYQILLCKDWVVLPNVPTIQLSILQKRHDCPLAGNRGQEKTFKLVKRDFHWSGMNQFIKDYASSCQECSRNKNIHHKNLGLLKPLAIPNGPWICLSMDFITQLPLSNSFDSILVIVDTFSKTVVFIPTMSSITSFDLGHLFIKHIFSKHGLPSRIVSDRGSLFVSSFGTNLCQQLKISRDLSTSCHLETDGQTERVNQILEQYLWMYVSYHEDNWNTWLPLA